MSAALSKALQQFDAAWLESGLAESSYLKVVGGKLYAVVVSDDRILAVYRVSARAYTARRLTEWPGWVTDAGHEARVVTRGTPG